VTERDLAYWLQGALELARVDAFTAEQVSTLRSHVALVRDGGVFTGQVLALVGVATGKDLVDHLRPVVDGYFVVVTRKAQREALLPTALLPPHYGEPRRYC
jgi:hypothetical protein